MYLSFSFKPLMKHFYLLSLLLFLNNSSVFSQPKIKWQRSVGLGTVFISGEATVTRTDNHGYIMCGRGNRIFGGTIDWNLMVAAISDTGGKRWTKSFGGSGNDAGEDIIPVGEGYMIVGYATSKDGDLTNIHSDSSGNPSMDVWVLKLNDTGGIIWQKTYGGSGSEIGMSIKQVPNGGYIIAANTNSNDGDVTGYHGNGDVWILRIDDTGKIMWQKTLGGSQNETIGELNVKYGNIELCSDGGFIVCSRTSSNDGDVSGNHGGTDVWLVKLNASGTIVWQKCYGGSNDDLGNHILPLTNDGYCVIGSTNSADGDVKASSYGGIDVWLLKINSVGSILKQNSYGGSNTDYGMDIETTNDGGYLFSAQTNSTDKEITANRGSWDYWLVNLDTNLDLKWQRCLGGSGREEVCNAFQTSDSGYLVCARTGSADSDVTVGATGCWVVKLKDKTLDTSTIVYNTSSKNNILVYPTLTNGIVKIFLPQGYDNAQLELINALGQKIDFNFERGNLYNTLDLQHIPSGMYLLEIWNNGELSTFKILKQ
jgi:hypothetical protein